MFAVFTPEVAAPGHEGEAQLREFSWHELATHDYPAAFRFYERLFGWEKSDAMDMGEGGIYQMFSRNGVMLGGMFNASPQMPAPPGWLHYVLVDDVNRAVEAVKLGWRPGPQRSDGSARRRLDRAVHGSAGRDVRRARAEEVAGSAQGSGPKAQAKHFDYLVEDLA